MKKSSDPQIFSPGQKNPVSGENVGAAVQYSDYSDDLTLNDADIIDIDDKKILIARDEKIALGDYTDDLTLNDADITDIGKYRLPGTESCGIDNLRDYADDLTLNDADICDIDSPSPLLSCKTDHPKDSESYKPPLPGGPAVFEDYRDDLTLNDADIVEIDGPGLLPKDSEPPSLPGGPAVFEDYRDDLTLNDADIVEIDRPGLLPKNSEPPPLPGVPAVFEDYRDDLSLNEADIIEIDSPGLRRGDHPEDDSDSDEPDILSDLPDEIIELMCYTENDKAQIRDDESLMPEIIREVMGLNDTDDGSLSGIAEKGLFSDSDTPIPCPADKTDFLKEQNDLIELTDISTDFIDDNEDTVVNFEKRESKEGNDIIELTDIALPLPDDNEDTVDLEEKDTLSEESEIQELTEMLSGEAAEAEENNLFLPENREQASAFSENFNELGEDSDLSEDIEAVAELINIVVRFPDDDEEDSEDSGDEGDRKKKDLLDLLEKDIYEDRDIADPAEDADTEYEEAPDPLREETDAAPEDEGMRIFRAENEDSELYETADARDEKDNRNAPNFYFLGETDEDSFMEKDLIALLEMESPAEIVAENKREFQFPSERKPFFIKNASIKEEPRSETLPEMQPVSRNSSDPLAEYLEDIVKDIICEKIDQMIIDQQRIVDVIEKAVLKEKNKLIRDLTAEG